MRSGVLYISQNPRLAPLKCWDVPYVSQSRWPAPLEYLEEFITSTGHNLTVDHNKGERIEDKYIEFRNKMNS